jgi:hypothetical protein
MTTQTSADLLESAAADRPRRPVPRSLRAARGHVTAATDALAHVHDEALTRAWSWKGGSEEELRYGYYRIAESFERAGIEAASAMRAAGEPERSVELIGPATAARWDLQGLLHDLHAATWDADPGGGEWTVRRTLGHVISSQRGYALGSSWWLTQRLPADDPALPRFPEGLGDDLPTEEEEAEGTPEEVRARLDTALDDATERLASLSAEQLAYAGRWSGFAVDLGFRQSRWASHIREHTIQVEKTLAMLDIDLTEVDRLVRLVLAAWGRAESTVFGAEANDRALEILARAASDAEATANEIATLAGA